MLLTNEQQQRVITMFKEVAPKAKIMIDTEDNKGSKGHIATNPYYGVREVRILNAEYSSNAQWNYMEFDGTVNTDNANVLKVVYHELGHIIQFNLGHIGNKRKDGGHSYAFNEVTTEYVAGLLQGDSIQDIGNYRYIQSYLKRVSATEQKDLIKVVCELYPKVYEILERHNLI